MSRLTNYAAQVLNGDDEWLSKPWTGVEHLAVALWADEQDLRSMVLTPAGPLFFMLPDLRDSVTVSAQRLADAVL